VSREIEMFLGIVSKCADRTQVIESIRQLRTTKEYECPPMSVFALHVILDLYDEDSSLQANINRMTVSLEAAAHELLHISKCIRVLR
jgi:hypothetical protein